MQCKRVDPAMIGMGWLSIKDYIFDNQLNLKVQGTSCDIKCPALDMTSPCSYLQKEFSQCDYGFGRCLNKPTNGNRFAAYRK